MSEKIVLIPSRDYLCDLDKEVENGKSYLCESGSSFVIELQLTGEQIQKGYHSGDCDADIEELMQVPEIKKQLDAIDEVLLTKWWDEVFLDGLPKTPVSVDKHQALSWLVFECCSNAIDGYCYEIRRPRKKRRTNWDRVRELNEILGDHPKFHFSLIQNAKEHRYPYCLAWNCCGAVERSLSFREMKQMAILLHEEMLTQ